MASSEDGFFVNTRPHFLFSDFSNDVINSSAFKNIFSPSHTISAGISLLSPVNRSTFNPGKKNTTTFIFSKQKLVFE
nr:hypothetical protein [Draconibacterium orientale]